MTEAGKRITRSAPAKVNLTLRVLGKRPDGYHELDGIMQKLDLYDTLHVERLDRPGVTLRCPASALPEDASNLVHRAASLYLLEAGLEKDAGVSLVLEKRIPVAAGLGGGSSDAAAALLAMDELFQVRALAKRLPALGKELGADVPFFVVSDTTVRAQGIGERMETLQPLRGCSVLLVNPGFFVSTASVFESFRLTKTDKVSSLSDSYGHESLDAATTELYNDLESVTIEQHPEIEEMKQLLLDSGATGALMSGSGPTVFGIFPDEGDADVQQAYESLQKKYGDGVFITRPLH